MSDYCFVCTYSSLDSDLKTSHHSSMTTLGVSVVVGRGPECDGENCEHPDYVEVGRHGDGDVWVPIYQCNSCGAKWH